MAHTFTIIVTDEEYKAMTLRVSDPDSWLDNALNNQIRKAAEWVIEEIMEDHSLLPPADLASIKQDLIDTGNMFKPPEEWPDIIKRDIIAATTMLTKAERDALEIPL